LLWRQPKKPIQHLWYEWKEVFVIGDLVWTWSAELETIPLGESAGRKEAATYPKAVNGYDLRTGELKKTVSTGPIYRANHHHRCYRNKATVRYILSSRRGSEFVDLEKGEHTLHNWVRGTCHVGMMPANGLQYVPPHPCVCYIDEKLNGFLALAPQRGDSPVPPAGSSERLRKGPAYGGSPSGAGPVEAHDSDWPAYRCNSARNGSVNTQLPDDSRTLWRVKLGDTVCPPIIVGELLFTALVEAHSIVCLNAKDGSRRWEFTTGGRIDSPPTWHKGTVLFGSADGCVYCVRAGDGQLVWRFRAASRPHLRSAFGHLESVQPVHGSVLVQDGKVYCAAGRSSQLDGGISLYALDAGTGRLCYHTRLEGPDYAVNALGQLAMRPAPTGTRGEFEVNNRLPMGALSDVLMSDGARIYMRSRAFDSELKLQQGRPTLVARSGYLDDTYFKRAPWTFGDNQTYGRLLVHDNRSVYCVRMFDSLKGLDPTVFFTPGARGYLLFARNLGGKQDVWSQRVPVRIRAMALASQRLVVAGPPDVIAARDPLGAFEGRLGGLLYVLETVSGRKLNERTLPSSPVFNGMAVANGRIYLADEAGCVSCLVSS
jgi:outer membrane protein assembly factor BamB